MSINSIRKMLLEDYDSENELELLSAIVLARRYFKRKGGSSSRRGGSVPGRIFIDRDSLQGHQRLFLAYFADSPVYPPKYFAGGFGCIVIFFVVFCLR
jgi:hypothetical protein